MPSKQVCNLQFLLEVDPLLLLQELLLDFIGFLLLLMLLPLVTDALKLLHQKFRTLQFIAHQDRRNDVAPLDIGFLELTCLCFLSEFLRVLDLFFLTDAEPFREDVLKVLAPDFVVVQFEMGVSLHRLLLDQLLQVGVVLTEGKLS